jgi:hypothetical protein
MSSDWKYKIVGSETETRASEDEFGKGGSGKVDQGFECRRSEAERTCVEMGSVEEGSSSRSSLRERGGEAAEEQCGGGGGTDPVDVVPIVEDSSGGEELPRWDDMGYAWFADAAAEKNKRSNCIIE